MARSSPSPIGLALLVLGYTHKMVADECGIHRVTCTNMLNERIPPNAAFKEGVSRLLDRPVDELFPSENRKGDVGDLQPA